MAEPKKPDVDQIDNEKIDVESVPPGMTLIETAKLTKLEKDYEYYYYQYRWLWVLFLTTVSHGILVGTWGLLQHFRAYLTGQEIDPQFKTFWLAVRYYFWKWYGGRIDFGDCLPPLE